MSLTPAELERRRDTVGASEVGLLFGLPSWKKRTLSDLWWEKKYGTVGSKGTKSTELGTRLEPVILDMAEEQLGTKIVDRQRWVKLGSNAATLDGRVAGGGPLIEAKTSGLLGGPSTLGEWGDDDSDDAPDNYIMQVQAQLLVTGAEMAHLFAIIGGRGFAKFDIYPQPALMREIQARSNLFIESLHGDQPPPEVPQLETLKRLRRVPSKVIPRSDQISDLWEQLEAAKAVAKDAESGKELIQRKILTLLCDAEGAEMSGGMLTYYEQTRKASFSAESTFRVLRFSKGK